MGKKRSLWLIILVFLLSCINLKAENKVYEVEKLKVNVTLLENGDAKVNESWQVHFKSGEFTRFYVGKYQRLSEEEKYTDLTDVSFWINNTPCTLTEDTNSRLPGTASVTMEQDQQILAWYTKAENETMTFKVQYTLKGAVKKNESEEALFTDRLVGGAFEQPIKKLEVVLKLPQDGKVRLLEKGGCKASQKGDCVYFNKSHTKGLVRIQIAMPASLFSSSSLTVLQADKEESEGAQYGIYVSMGIGLGIFIGIIMLYCFWDEKRCQAASDIKKALEAVRQLEAAGYGPADYNRCLYPKTPGMNSFRLLFLDLIRKEVIVLHKGQVALQVEKCRGLNKAEQQTLVLLKKYLPFKEGISDYTISFKGFRDGLIINYAAIVKDSQKLKKALLRKRHRNNDVYFKRLKKYFEHGIQGGQYPNTTEEILQQYFKGQAVDLLALYYLGYKLNETSIIYESRNYEKRKNSRVDDMIFCSEIGYLLDTSAALYQQTALYTSASDTDDDEDPDDNQPFDYGAGGAD